MLKNPTEYVEELLDVSFELIWSLSISLHMRQAIPTSDPARIQSCMAIKTLPAKHITTGILVFNLLVSGTPRRTKYSYGVPIG